MAEVGINAETVLAGLQDIRLPANAPGGLLAEILVVVGFGLALALLAEALLTVVFPARQQTPPMAVRLAALAHLSDDDRALALLHLIRAEKPDAMPQFRPALYQRGAGPGIAMLEAVLLAEDAQHA